MLGSSAETVDVLRKHVVGAARLSAQQARRRQK